MLIPLSIDLRERILSYYKKGNSVKEIVMIFEVGQNTVYSLLRLYNETGNIKPWENKNGRKPKLTEEDLRKIEDRILKEHDITLEELKDKLELPVCISALYRTINNKLELKLKKTLYDKNQER